jgi:hypothetical protein
MAVDSIQRDFCDKLGDNFYHSVWDDASAQCLVRPSKCLAVKERLYPLSSLRQRVRAGR